MANLKNMYKKTSLRFSLFHQELIEDQETPCILDCDEIVSFLIEGTQFQIIKSKFAYWPRTRLSRLIRAKTKSEMLNLCDSVTFCEKSGKPKDYIFLRNAKSFNSILDMFKRT